MKCHEIEWGTKRIDAAVEGFEHLSAMRTRRITIATVALALLLVAPSKNACSLLIIFGALWAIFRNLQKARKEIKDVQLENGQLLGQNGQLRCHELAPQVIRASWGIGLDTFRFRMDRKVHKKKMTQMDEEHKQKMEFEGKRQKHLDDLLVVICWCLKVPAIVAGGLVTLRLVLFGFFRTLYDLCGVFALLSRTPTREGFAAKDWAPGPAFRKLMPSCVPRMSLETSPGSAKKIGGARAGLEP